MFSISSSSSLRHQVTSRRQRRELGTQPQQQQQSQRRFPKSAKYQVHMEYSQPAGYISRLPDGRFQLYDQEGVDELYGDEDLLEVATTNTRANPSGQQQWSPYHQNYYNNNQQQHPKPWAIAPNQQHHLSSSSSSLFNSSKAWERTPDIHTIYSPRDPRFRTSSPGPLAQYRARNFPVEDISSVLLPSSVERSFPTGTLSSDSQHHFSPSSSSAANSNAIFSPSYELPSLRILHGQLPNIQEEEDQGFKPPQALKGNLNSNLVEGNYDYPPIRRPIPVAWYPNYQRPIADIEMQDDEEQQPPPRPPRYAQREPPPRPIEPPPPVPDIKQREMPRRQLDVYMRIQAQDEESPLATSSPPRLDRRIARVPPSPATRDHYIRNSGDHEGPLGVPYTRERLIEAVTQVRQQGGAYRLNLEQEHHHLEVPPQFVGNVSVTVPDVTNRTGDEGDSTMTSDEAFHALGVVGVTPNSRVSVTSAGTGSSGRGSKPASVSHSRGDSLQGELQEYSPTSRSSSSGFASRNTSQSQPSPHQLMVSSSGQVGGQAPRTIISQPSRPLPPLNVSTDENYEFDSVSPLEIPSAAESASGPGLLRDVEEEEENVTHAVETPASTSGDADLTAEGASDDFSNFSKVSKYDDVEIERRIPALKQEFQQFRRRQRERFNDDLMESEC